MDTRLIIAITGPVASGKTTLTEDVCEQVENKLGKGCTQIVHQDNYYIPGGHPNYDIPSTIDFQLLLDHLLRLGHGEIITQAPRYDMNTKQRHYDLILWPAKFIFVEGHQLLNGLTFNWDLSVYLNTPLTLCMRRRIKRDQDSFEQHVRHTIPAHYKFTERIKKKCDIVL